MKKLKLFNIVIVLGLTSMMVASCGKYSRTRPSNAPGTLDNSLIAANSVRYVYRTNSPNSIQVAGDSSSLLATNISWQAPSTSTNVTFVIQMCLGNPSYSCQNYVHINCAPDGTCVVSDDMANPASCQPQNPTVRIQAVATMSTSGSGLANYNFYDSYYINWLPDGSAPGGGKYPQVEALTSTSHSDWQLSAPLAQ